MSNNIVIKVENLSKQYRLGVVSSGTLADDLNLAWSKLRGKENPLLKIGDVNDRSKVGESDYVWSLKDINFEVKQGEVLGIIGRNGAGKSTLLKILSKVTTPTTGKIKTKGRIASLLEVGTGFHPELTGRENIFLNGAILGMKKNEIKAKFDEIVSFSGVERYIDTPVKRYSSGMYVRLAFAVAAHLEPEILIVDEVLAVGDAEFQKKCLGKMKDVSGEGRTVLFVSHNMQAVDNLCDNLIILDNGEIAFNGETKTGILKYLDTDNYVPDLDFNKQINLLNFDDVFQLLEVKLFQDNQENVFLTTEPINIILKYNVKKNTTGLRIGFDINDLFGNCIFRSFHDDDCNEMQSIRPGVYSSLAKIPETLLKEENYIFSLSIGIHNVRWIIYDKIKLKFSLINVNGLNNAFADHRPGLIMPKIIWKTKTINEI
jgi:lipopolysaccharide transport system ATP-binding protein